MKVLSLFDGISCGRIALERAGVKVDEYTAYEIDKNAIEISKNNWDDIKYCGDVTKADFSQYIGYDMVIAGFPCQDLSINKANREGLSGKRSGLFWYLVKALKIIKPKYFLVENNYMMPDDAKETITKELGVNPIMINSARVSAQQRRRLYWTNITNIIQPDYCDKHIIDICCKSEKEKNLYSLTNFNKNKDNHNIQDKPIRIGTIGNGGQGERVYSAYGKSVTLTANGGGRGAKTGLYLIDGKVRKLTPIEAERLQTLPDNYTDCVSDVNRYKAIGNGWTVDVIAHIFKNISKSVGE